MPRSFLFVLWIRRCLHPAGDARQFSILDFSTKSFFESALINELLDEKYDRDKGE